MKTKILFSPAILSVSLLLFSFTFDSNENGTNGNPINVADSASVDETRFKVNYDETKGLLTVSVIGQLEEYSSVSVTNNRGSEFHFSFVESGASSIEFNVKDLNPGSYYVVLNTGEEIRMKRFLKAN